MQKEIGGYFNLELRDNDGFLHDDGFLVNSGRNALELVLLSLGEIKKLYIPYYTCDSVLEPIEKLSIPYEFYSINNILELSSDIILKSSEFLIYTNYFGLKDKYIKDLVYHYNSNVIIDNSQSFFSEPIDGISTIYSPRKFVGVPDGGIAYLSNSNEIDITDFNVDKSYDRCSHLLKRYDELAFCGYNDFKNNSKQLYNQSIHRMSKLTQSLLSNIDFEEIKRKRINNFYYLHNRLGKLNKLVINTNGISVPMVYPFLCDDINLRKHLIENKIYVATYWPNVLEWCKDIDFEYKLAKQIIPLPIDQRYGDEEMEYIIKKITK